MKPNLTSLTTSQYASNHGSLGPVAEHIRGTAFDVEPSHGWPQLELTSAPVWRHTLVLKGTLDSRSASELEDEIDCLYQEGVTILTLDLRQLDAIDSTGVTVITSGGSACTTRGRDFAVIPGSRSIHRALAKGGAGDFLTPDPNAILARRLSSRSSDDHFSDVSTTGVIRL